MILVPAGHAALLDAEALAAAAATRTAGPDVDDIDALGKWLCSAALASVAVLAAATELTAARLRSQAGAQDDSAKKAADLEELEERDCSGDMSDPRLARWVAVVAGWALLAVFSVVYWATGQLAPLSICAVGLGVLFTMRPVEFAGGAVRFNMATVPWLCIFWLLATRAMPFSVVWTGIMGQQGVDILPWTMLVTFASSVYMCTSLEVTGGLDAFAHQMTKTFGDSPTLLFFALASLAAALTCLIPDDVVTMTLAPTVCALCAELRLDAKPYLHAIFYNANIWAVTLVTGNITNVIVADVTHKGFLSFAASMIKPGAAAGATSMVLLWATFSSSLQAASQEAVARTQGAAELPLQRMNTMGIVQYRLRARICAARFGFVFVWASLDGLHHWPIWLTMGTFAGASLAMDLAMDAMGLDDARSFTMQVLQAVPFDMFFFYLALFVLVQQLLHAGVVDVLARDLAPLANSPFLAAGAIGFLALLAAQAVSSVPMTILMLQVVMHVPGWRQGELEGNEQALHAKNLALYALVLGSNFCGNLTRMGTMGGQMWVRIARNHGVELHDGAIALRGFTVMIPVMCAGLAVLCATL